MKRSWLNINVMGSLRRGFFFGTLAIFTISPFHFDVVDGIRADSLLAMERLIEDDTLVKDPATGKQIPFSELKSGNPKLSSSLNQLLSAYQYLGKSRLKTFAGERGMKLKDDLIQVVIEINADSHEPLPREILYELRDRIVQVGGKFELDFHNLLQVLLPVHALEEVANRQDIKFVREPFRPRPLMDGPGTGDQSKGSLLKLLPSIERDESSETEKLSPSQAYAEVWFCLEDNSPRPNLTPYKPSGWSDKIVVSTNAGDHLDDSPLSDTDTLYIDFALGNDGTAPTNQTYYTGLYIDDVLEQTFGLFPPHESGYYFGVVDYSIGALFAGTHTIKLVVDYDDRISESDETDNEYTKTITVIESQPVTSEGVSLIGADKWQDDGCTGEGVKIAIIDGGFKNYSFLLGKELPDSVTTNFYGSEDDIYGIVHGTACAEIIHDMAPDAQFFLTQPRTVIELWNAVNWCIGQGVQIMSYSMGWNIPAGPLDGTGPINDIVNQAVNHGITWVSAAGNEAQAHWGGEFYDPDGDGFLNFSGTDKTNDFSTYGGQKVSIGMIWNDCWGSSDNDYDLYVYDLADPSNPVTYSANIQDGDDDPSESISFTPQSGVSYGFAIRKESGAPKNIHVTLEAQNPLQYQVPATSICIPADNPDVITVGAIAWNSPSTIEYFSSQGPTTDGRIKPDLVAPDRVSTSGLTYGVYQTTGGFAGTSASCPHVAGACALVKQAYPAWSSSQIKDFLESEATDLGIPGKDNIHGSGFAYLYDPSGNGLENGYLVTSDLWIRAVINTEEKGLVEAVWQKGGEDTSRGDRVIWGYFYASPSDVTWGSENNPDLFVKIWFDVSGRVDVNFFHVSVPDIDVYSDYPYDGTYDQQGTTTMSRRYIRQYYENDQSYSDENYEDGNPPSGYSATGNPFGYSTINDLRIGSIINTVEKGPVDAAWRLGGQDTTSRGDQVVWGYFYASSDDVTWGSQNNPDLFMKIWFDASGRVDVNFFHVSVPDIEVYSDLPSEGAYDQKGTTIMDNRYIRHEYTK